MSAPRLCAVATALSRMRRRMLVAPSRRPVASRVRLGWSVEDVGEVGDRTIVALRARRGPRPVATRRWNPLRGPFTERCWLTPPVRRSAPRLRHRDDHTSAIASSDSVRSLPHGPRRLTVNVQEIVAKLNSIGADMQCVVCGIRWSLSGA
jgi:hypothetical protein